MNIRKEKVYVFTYDKSYEYSPFFFCPFLRVYGEIKNNVEESKCGVI